MTTKIRKRGYIKVPDCIVQKLKLQERQIFIANVNIMNRKMVLSPIRAKQMLNSTFHTDAQTDTTSIEQWKYKVGFIKDHYVSLPLLLLLVLEWTEGTILCVQEDGKSVQLYAPDLNSKEYST